MEAILAVLVRRDLLEQGDSLDPRVKKGKTDLKASLESLALKEQGYIYVYVFEETVPWSCYYSSIGSTRK